MFGMITPGDPGAWSGLGTTLLGPKCVLSPLASGVGSGCGSQDIDLYSIYAKRKPLRALWKKNHVV